jgi:hypothetical protein
MTGREAVSADRARSLRRYDRLCVWLRKGIDRARRNINSWIKLGVGDEKRGEIIHAVDHWMNRIVVIGRRSECGISPSSDRYHMR